MTKSIRILIIEDSAADAALVLNELKRGNLNYDAVRVDTLSAVTAALDRESWNLIICDHSLPGFDSLHVLQLVNERNLTLPFIIVSGTIGEETAVKAMKAGAHDYVMKSNLARLKPAIERELREASSRRAKTDAETALRRSEKVLNEFFERASVGLHFTGPNGVILRVNQAELDMLGYSQYEYAGHAFADFFADKKAAEEVMQRLSMGEDLQNFETRLRCKNGTVKHVSLNANMLHENGEFVQSSCFIRDITDRKLAEEALAYLAAIVESSEDAVIGLTLDGFILSWNMGAARMFGYSAEEVTGCSVSALMPNYRPDELWQMLGRLRNGTAIERYETVRRRRDGSTLEVASTLSPIKDCNNNIIGISAIERDITIPRREEQERLQLIADLTEALAKIRNLHRLLMKCPVCKRVRDSQGIWQKVDATIPTPADNDFSQNLCPDCLNLFANGHDLNWEQVPFIKNSSTSPSIATALAIGKN